MTDEALIALIIEGDSRAFSELYSRYHQKIFALCFHYINHKEEAEELLQDVFVTVHKHVSKFNSQSSFSTWIYSISVNKCLDHLRYKNAKKRFAFFTHLIEDKAIETNEPRYADSQTEALYKAINSLSEQQKTALILTQIQELSIKETAAIMHNTPKAIESLVQRAKANLQKKLKKN